MLALHRQSPSADSRELIASISFAAHVGPCYPALTAGLPAQLGALLEEHHAALDPALRGALLQALILLRNRGMMPALQLLQLCFRCFRGRDKALRANDPEKQAKYTPAHLQEVTDEQGRKRFHGAFTGGFSAGYFNTVGSEEGWAPSEWRSTRSARTLHSSDLECRCNT